MNVVKMSTIIIAFVCLPLGVNVVNVCENVNHIFCSPLHVALGRCSSLDLGLGQENKSHDILGTVPEL